MEFARYKCLLLLLLLLVLLLLLLLLLLCDHPGEGTSEKSCSW